MKQEYSELFKIYPEARKEVVELIKSGAQMSELSQCLGVTKQCLYNWVSGQVDIDNFDRDPDFRSAKENLHKVVSNLEAKSSKARNKEMWYVKKVLSVDYDLRMRIVELFEKHGYTIIDVSRQVGVPTSSLHYWKAGLKDNNSRHKEISDRLNKFRESLKKFKD